MPESEPLRVLHAASEIHPLVKTGGLADVVAALPRALRARGIDARVLVPGYPDVLAASRGLALVSTDPDLFEGGPARILAGHLDGVDAEAYVLDAPGLYARAGGPYEGRDGLEFVDNHRRFAALSWAAAQLGCGADPRFQPDIVHGHDWQTGLAPAYLAHRGAGRPGTVHTIHNLAYQGRFDASVFAELGLPREAMRVEGVEYYGGVGMLKAALWYADRITTVSPTYAREIQTPEHGAGLDGLLRGRSEALVGILNGVDHAVWDPAKDPSLPAPYDAAHPGAKAAAKQALRARFGLPEAKGPLFGVVSRLTHDKGLDLLLDAFPAMVERDAQLVLLGSGEPSLERRLSALAEGHPRRVGLHLGYDEPLAHLVQGGADVVVVPSRTEPCGLTQLYAQRYGSLPLVRRTGGLADTVVDASPAALAEGRATGFAFDEPSAAALQAALVRACTLFARPHRWLAVQSTAMRRDFSWETSAGEYIALYEAVRRGDARLTRR